MGIVPLEYLGREYPGNQQYSLDFFKNYPGKDFRRYDLEIITFSYEDKETKDGEESFITDLENKILLWKSIFTTPENKTKDLFGRQMKGYYRLGVRVLCPAEKNTRKIKIGHTEPIEKQNLAMAYSPNHLDGVPGKYLPQNSYSLLNMHDTIQDPTFRAYRIIGYEEMNKDTILDWISSIRKFSPHIN